MLVGHLPAAYLAFGPALDRARLGAVEARRLLGVAAIVRRPAWARLVAVTGASGLLHLLLDTVAGAIRWGAPFSDRATTLVTIPATHASWIVSFVTHWTFGVELVLVCAALIVWGRRHGRR